MKSIFVFLALILVVQGVNAQNAIVDTPLFGNVTIVKDPRIDILGKKLAEYNEAVAAKKARAAKGYRLMLLSTNDRNKAMSVRSALIQQFPDHKVYMIFQSPFIKLKFGNFVEKKEAEDMRKKLLSSGIITGNIYLLPETVEVRPDTKLEEEE